ncbi:MAG: YncE family protein [Candidatus Nanopelagicales bacterium]
MRAPSPLRLPALILAGLICQGCAGAPHPGVSAPVAATVRAGASTSPSPSLGTTSAAQIGRLGSPIAVGAGPDGMVVADSSLWVANFGAGTVSRVDPQAHRVVATVPVVGGPISVAGVGTSVWVADYQQGEVSRIDAVTNRVTATVAVGPSPVSIVPVAGVLWVFNQGNATATIIDPRTTKATATIPTGAHAGFVTLAGNHLWIPDFMGAHQVVELDPVSRQILRRIPVGSAPISISFAAGSGWVSNTGDGTITRLDPATGRTLATISVPGGSLGPLIATPRAIIVSNYGANALTVINPTTNSVVGTIVTGDEPQSIIPLFGDLWLDEGGSNDVRQVILRP